MNLKEAVKQYKGKKELYDLPKLEVDKLEIKTDTFPAKDNPDKKIEFQYFEVDGWKYTINGKLMSSIKYLLEQKPNMKFIRFMRAPDGSTFVIDVE